MGPQLQPEPAVLGREGSALQEIAVALQAGRKGQAQRGVPVVDGNQRLPRPVPAGEGEVAGAETQPLIAGPAQGGLCPPGPGPAADQPGAERPG